MIDLAEKAAKFSENPENLPKFIEILKIFQIFEFGAVQRYKNLVDLEKC